MITGVLAIDGYNAWLRSHGDTNAVRTPSNRRHSSLTFVQYSDTIDVAGHVGGILAGLAYYLVRVRFRM